MSVKPKRHRALIEKELFLSHEKIERRQQQSKILLKVKSERNGKGVELVASGTPIGLVKTVSAKAVA